jgi:two-component system, NtrC family, sensor kinase
MHGSGEGKVFLSIHRKLLIYVLMVSSIFTVVTTMINFYMDYSSEKEVQSQTLHQIEKSTLASLTKAVWDLDDEQLKRNVDGLMRLHDIIAVVIIDGSGSVVFQDAKEIKDKDVERYSFEKSYQLQYVQSAQLHQLGVFRLKVTNYYMLTRLLKKMAIFFAGQGVKTVVVSFILLGLFNLVVTNHVNSLVQGLKEMDSAKLRPLALDRSEHRRDELDILCDSFNQMIIDLGKLDYKRQDEMARKESALKQLSHLASLGEMAGNVGHEINNPLTIIQGGSHRLRRLIDSSHMKKGEMERSSIILNMVENGVSRIQSITKSLTVLARGSDDSDFAIGHIGAVVDESCALISEKMKSRNIFFESEIDDPHFMVMVNRVQMGQVVINLVNNAVDAVSGSESPWIKIRVISDSSSVNIQIQDSGDGISEEVKDSLFIPFFTTKQVGKGTGLGLSISSKIIENHGGSLTLDTIQQYTTFIITLPRADSFTKKLSA